jgi:hypothetical protein
MNYWNIRGKTQAENPGRTHILKGYGGILKNRLFWASIDNDGDSMMGIH